jgi:hypothetical protein
LVSLLLGRMLGTRSESEVRAAVFDPKFVLLTNSPVKPDRNLARCLPCEVR